MGGLVPEFRPGPSNGEYLRCHDEDFAYFLLAECAACGWILGRERPGSRILTWQPDTAAWAINEASER